jgi:N-acetylmuramoyl-L-alanine amidase
MASLLLTAAPAPREGGLARARAELSAVKNDPHKRRLRHNWERAIRALKKAAQGKDTAPALFDAARASYALYRFSAAESDREEALKLADRAGALGLREARSFAVAVRREAGDVKARGKDREHDHDEAEHEEPDIETAPEPAPIEALAVPAESLGSARISEVRAWSSPEYTRVAVYLSRQVGHYQQELAAEGGQPRRLALDFRPARLGPGAERIQVPEGGQVDRVRVGQRNDDTARVVLDLAGSDAYQTFWLEDPPRLIVDVGTREARRAAQASAFPATMPVQPQPVEAPSPRGPSKGSIRRVIVDAGHGGHDSGAIGPTRLKEKEVTLGLARRLAKRLTAAGFEVILTRNRDSTVALEDRTARANTARGDLFVSLHANAHPRRDKRGIETYYLDVTNDRYAARLAARENGAALPPQEASDDAVQRILTDLDAKSSADASRHLARLVQREVCERVRERVGEVRDIGVKSALFYVLLGARMPAVLVETGFLSNRAEEKRLRDGKYQESIAEGIARAVERFSLESPELAQVP